MQFIIEKLEENLRMELSARESARPFLDVPEKFPDNATIKAFKESYAIADERIPHLIRAIQLLRKDVERGGMFGDLMRDHK